MPFNFALTLPAGTYSVLVSSNGSSNLLPSAYVVAPAFVVTGPTTNAIFDERPHALTGRITVNGTNPATPTSCSSASAASVRFTSSSYSALATVPCRLTAGTFDFAVALPAGTYAVSIIDERVGSNLLLAPYVVAPTFVVSGPTTNVVFDVPSYPVAGRITVNGATPTMSAACSSSSSVATMVFTSPSYSTTAVVPCSPTLGPFAFALTLPPGTYSTQKKKKKAGNGTQGRVASRRAWTQRVR